MTPDARDGSSDEYRKIENRNIFYTISTCSDPGVPFGKEFSETLPDDRLEEDETRIVRHAARQHSLGLDATRHPRIFSVLVHERTVDRSRGCRTACRYRENWIRRWAIFAVAVVVINLVIAFLDMSFYAHAPTSTWASFSGVFDRLPSMAERENGDGAESCRKGDAVQEIKACLQSDRKSAHMSSMPRVSTAKRGPGHIPSLDGLRAASFLVVFLAHAGSEKFMPANSGLAIFFFLTGYLITTLLRVEFEQAGTINLQQFYLRRVLRIFPPFYLVLAAASALTLTGALDWSLHPGAVLAQMLHVSNYYIVHAGWWTGRAPGTWVGPGPSRLRSTFTFSFRSCICASGAGCGPPAARCSSCWPYAGRNCAGAAPWCLPSTPARIAPTWRPIHVSNSILYGCILAIYGNPALGPDADPDRWWKAFWLPVSGAVLLGTLVIPRRWFEETFRYTLESLALFPLFLVAVRYPTWGPCRLLNVRWIRFVGTLFLFALPDAHNGPVPPSTSGFRGTRQSRGYWPWACPCFSQL